MSVSANMQVWGDLAFLIRERESFQHFRHSLLQEVGVPYSEQQPGQLEEPPAQKGLRPWQKDERCKLVMMVPNKEKLSTMKKPNLLIQNWINGVLHISSYFMVCLGQDSNPEPSCSCFSLDLKPLPLSYNPAKFYSSLLGFYNKFWTRKTNAGF